MVCLFHPLGVLISVRTHVTGDKSWFHHMVDIEPCHVGLPNGTSAVATQTGTIILSPTITLTHVQYVPTFSCTLLSVSQFTNDLQCIVQFSSSMCAIEDQLRELIGTGSRKDGLYYFDGVVPQPTSIHATISEFQLWHQRMGHPSEKVVRLLPPLCGHKGSLDHHCEVCFRAKHPRDKFPDSSNKASRIFEKIHCDLWGPYRHVSFCGARDFLTIVDDYSKVVWVYLMIDKMEFFVSS